MAIKKNANTQAKTNEWNHRPVSSAQVTAARWVNESISFNMMVNDTVQVNGCWYRTGEKDGKEYEIISLPQYKASNGKYYHTVYFPISDELKSNIIYQLQEIVNE